MALYETSKKRKVVIVSSSDVDTSSSSNQVSTTLTGIVKAVSGTLASAIPNVDYQVPSSINCDEIDDGINHHLVSNSEKSTIANTSGINTGDETSTTIKSKIGISSSISDGYLSAADYQDFKNKVNKKQAIAYSICLRR